MVKFIGKYEAKVDDKGRLVFPSGLKCQLPEGELPKFVIKKDIFEDCLEMYIFSEWEKQSENVKNKLNFLNKEHAMFWRKYMNGRALVQLDPKMGRFMIPKELLESIGITKDVVFSGNDYKIEIWAKEKFESANISDDVFISLAETLSHLG